MNEWFETHPFLKQMRRRLSVELAVCLLLFCGVFLAARYAGGWRQRGRTLCLGRKRRWCSWTPDMGILIRER